MLTEAFMLAGRISGLTFSLERHKPWTEREHTKTVRAAVSAAQIEGFRERKIF